MDKVKILIVEDEVLIAESLREILEGLGYEVTGHAMRAKEALKLIEKDQPDIAILDINLKGVEDGIWLADQIRQNYSFPYIFLTSFGNRTTVEQAVKTKPYGYLIKPFKKVDIYSAIEVALSNFAQADASENGGAEKLTSSQIVTKNSLFIKEDYLFRKLMFDDILFIKADDNYLEIHTTEKRHVIKSTMKDFLKKLPEDSFMQTHRSWVVQLEKVESFGPNFVNVAKKEIPISATYKETLVERLTSL